MRSGGPIRPLGIGYAISGAWLRFRGKARGTAAPLLVLLGFAAENYEAAAVFTST